MCVCMCVCVCVCTYIYIHRADIQSLERCCRAWTCKIYLDMCMSIEICIYIYMCVCVCVCHCVCVHGGKGVTVCACMAANMRPALDHGCGKQTSSAPVKIVTRM